MPHLSFRSGLVRGSFGLLVMAVIVASVSAPAQAEPRYAWQTGVAAAGAGALEQRFVPPAGFEREAVAAGSFAEWLRGLPMKAEGAPVLLHTGAQKWRQDVHAGVIDIDVGKRDLQQCADAVMRLRAEWLYALGRRSDIAFNDTEGKRLRFAARAKQDYPGFRKYMDYVFAYAGTYSLERELAAASADDIRAGDVFIKGGFPGHAVLVTDIVVNRGTGERRFLLTQSYMPAQEIHVLKNPAATDGSVWYSTDFGDMLETPEWRFSRQQLKRWKT